MKFLDRLFGGRTEEPRVLPEPVAYQVRPTPIPRKRVLVQTSPLAEVPVEPNETDDAFADPDIRKAIKLHGQRRKVWWSPQRVAEDFITYFREEGYWAVPHLPEDLDWAVAQFCDDHNVERVDGNAVREIISAQPGCRRVRPRLSMTNPQHKFIIQRLQARKGYIPERATLYFFSQYAPTATHDPEMPVEMQSVSTKRPPKNRAGRKRTQPQGGQQVATPPEGSDFGWDYPDRRVA